MLRKRPEDRYQTAEGLARVLNVVAEPTPQFTRAGSDEAKVGPTRVIFAVGDIDASEADVIVNAANSEMVMNLGAKLFLEAVRTFASFQPEHVREVRVVLFDDNALARWGTLLRSI